MKNIELLNICYKFFNRFIIADQLIESLENIDKQKFSKKEAEKIDNFINEIKKIADSNPNKEDEYVKAKRESIQKSIKRLENVPESLDFIQNSLSNLKKDLEREMDSHERWLAITNYITKNEYFDSCFDSLDDYEMLEFIAQNIKAPFPPKFSQRDFDRLVKAGKEHDEREWLWRLAFNYDDSGLNIDEIVDYFILKKDGYYLTELISAVGEYLDIDALIDKLNDKELIEYVIEQEKIIDAFVTDEHINKLKDKLNEIK